MTKGPSHTIPVAEETAHITTQEVESGKVRIQTKVDIVEEVAKGTLLEESVTVTRVPIGQDIDEAPTIRMEGDVMIIPVVEEVMVVEKRLRLKEELHVRRTTNASPVQIPVRLRRQRAVVTREEREDTSATGRHVPKLGR